MIASLLFYPAIWVMNRLRYAWKFVVIGFLILVPLAAVATLLYRSATEDITFNQKERWGIEYITAARDLLRAIERHRFLASTVLSGQTSYEGDLREAKARVDSLVPALDAVDARYGSDELLKTTTKWTSIKSEWAALAEKPFPNAAASEAAHDAVTAMLVDLILNYAGNFSNLILDPDLDSYWLMDAWVIKLPLLGETIDRVGLAALRAMAKGGLSTDERIELAGQVKILESTINDLVNTNMKTAYAENKNFGVKKFDVAIDPELGSRAERAQQRIRDLLNYVRERCLLPDRVGGAVPELRQAVFAAQDETYNFYQKVGPELDKLCEARVRDYTFNRRAGIALTLAGALVLIYIFTGFYQSVRRSVAYLGEATQRLIAGTSESFELESRDELGQMAHSYNDINRALFEARDLRARVERENAELQGNILNLLKVVSSAADGDLTARAQVTAGSLGSVADAFNQMLESWEHLLGDIQNLFNRTNDTVGRIQSSSQGMASGASQQVSGIFDASSSVRQMAEGLARVSSNAETAALAAKRAQESALAGVDTVQNVVRGMDGLRSSVQAGAKKIKNLGDRSMEITSIVGTITRISEQTNMLALNAAIEAARAGEHGRGFSVVADQVRQLAERTAAATQEIENLVRQIQMETNESVEAIERQTHVVEGESQVVGQAGEMLQRIREVSTQSAELIADISAISKLQVDGAKGVTGVMQEISEIATRTKEGADDSVRLTQELAGLSRQLQESVNKFQLSNGRG